MCNWCRDVGFRWVATYPRGNRVWRRDRCIHGCPVIRADDV